MTGKSLHATAGLTVGSGPGLMLLRMGLVSLLLGLSACAGPSLRLSMLHPPAEASVPIATANGAASGALAEEAIAVALGARAGRPGARALVAALRNGSPHASFVAGNRVSMLNDGPTTFAAYAEAITAAKEHIHLETYIFSDDELGVRFADLLVEKAASGVEVRVLYDGFGSWSSGAALFDRMRRAGIEVREFRPLDSVAALTSGRFNNRDHRKLLIVDGRVAFVGGINISGTYEHAPSSGSGRRADGERVDPLDDGWRDSQARIEGPAVPQFQAIFFATWARAGGGQLIRAERYFPQLAQRGTALVAAVASEAGGRTAGAMYALYLNAIKHARHKLWVTQAYFTPDKSLREALIAAAKRGVDTRILVPGFSDSNLTLHASRSIYGRLLKASVRIYEHEEAFVHAKTAVIDDVAVVVGSANLDLRSLLHNNEVIAVVIDAAFANGTARSFLEDLEAAKEISLAAWRSRPWLDRIKEHGARLFWYWI